MSNEHSSKAKETKNNDFEKCWGYKFAYTFWVIRDQEAINQVISDYFNNRFTHNWIMKWGIPMNCHKPYAASVVFKMTDKPTFNSLRQFEREGFAVHSTQSGIDFCIVTLTFSHWVSHIQHTALRDEFASQKEDLIRTIRQELYTPGGMGQIVANLEFKKASIE